MPWRGPEVPGEFPSLGYVAADWIESHLPIPDGPHVGEPFHLYDEQVQHLLWKYRLDPEAPGDVGNDAFRYGGSMIVRGQKWGKDPLLAAISLFHAFGPCDFAGWGADGEPVGKPHPSPWGAVAALNDANTYNTWLPLIWMGRHSDLVDMPGVEFFDHMVKLPCGNPIEPVPTTAWGRLGGRFTHVSFTENGLLIGDGERGGLKFARTLKRSVTGMNGQWTAATNTWDPTEESDAQRTYEAKDPHVFVDAKIARRRVEFDDDEGLVEEIRHLYGDSLKSRGGHVSEQRIIRDIRNSANGEAEVRRFFLSEIVSGERIAVEQPRWEAAARPKSRLRRKHAIALGFDGSRKRDATALVASRMRDGRLFPLKVWVPAEYGGKVPRTDVDELVSATFEAYEVTAFFADPFMWQDYLDLWSNRWDDRIFEFATNEERRMDKAVELFLTQLREGVLTHDGDRVLAEHVLAMALAKGKRKPPREDAETGLKVEHYLKVVKKREGLLIDAGVAAILATAARGKALEDGWVEQDDSGFNIW